MCRAFILFVLFSYLWVVNAINFVSPQPEQLLNCIRNTNNTTIIECPSNASCADWNDDFYCLCDKDFTLNGNWRTNNNESVYCLPLRLPKPEGKIESKLSVYIRAPVHKENVALAILLVLMAAIAFTAVVFFIQVVKPLKRTRKIYVQLRRKRHNRYKLEEFDEYDLSWHDSNPQLAQ